MAASVIVLVIAVDSLLLQPAAQRVDTTVSQKRFQDLYAAGDYSAALVEAQKAGAAAKRGRHEQLRLRAGREFVSPRPDEFAAVAAMMKATPCCGDHSGTEALMARI